MNLLQNLKKITLALAVTLMFVGSAKATNNLEITETAAIEIEYNTIESSMDADMYTSFMSMDLDCEAYKDGKWKERWRQFRDGFLDGFTDGLGGINGGNNNGGFSNTDLQVLKNFALNTIKTKDNFTNFEYEISELINADSQYITEGQLRAAFKNDQNMIEVYKKAIAKDGEQLPLDKVASKRGPWGKLGWAIGYIAAKIVLSLLP